MQPGRNDPCPCGSGKKYKKCCESSDTNRVSSEVSRADAAKDADRQLTDRLMRFAGMRYGDPWFSSAVSRYSGGESERVEEIELELVVPLAYYLFPDAEGQRPVAEVFLEDQGSRLPPKLRDVLEAQLEAYASVWEVRRIESGVGVHVVDLLTTEERFVHEVTASRLLTPRLAILARVVDTGGISFFAGIHPQPLEPRDADLVVRNIRRICRVRTRPVNRDRLRELLTQLALIHIWRALVERARNRPMPQFTNTDGDPLVVTTDYFEVDGTNPGALLSRLRSLDGAEDPQRDQSDPNAMVITITKPGNTRMKSWDNTVVGRLVIKGSRMRAESNSTRRADSLRGRIELHLKGLVRHRLREEKNPAELIERASKQSPRLGRRSPVAHQPELKEIEQEIKERHMLEWLDDEIPALGGLTPRQAAKMRRSRAALDLLLREFEYREARLPADERFDINRLRAELDMAADSV
jgi:hypothetical protein